VSYNRVRGLPFSAAELVEAIGEVIGSLEDGDDAGSLSDPSPNGHVRHGVDVEEDCRRS
jgi:hypothetical protein